MRRTIAVLITSHNRSELTSTCLASLRRSNGQFDLRVVLADAGSHDHTIESAEEAFPGTEVLNLSRDVYWNEGMRAAWAYALSLEPDFFLWLNDDVHLSESALGGLVRIYDRHAGGSAGRVIVVGSTTSINGSVTYGGYKKKSGISRLALRRLRPDEIECDTMNGNCVLLPAVAAVEVGINSSQFRHSIGDIDYGFRARRRGFHILEMKEPVAVLEKNESHIYNGAVAGLTISELLRRLEEPKGLPLREWLFFCRSYGGVTWPINFVLRYVRILPSAIWHSLAKRRL